MRSGRLPHLAVAFAAFLSAFPVRGEEPIETAKSGRPFEGQVGDRLSDRVGLRRPLAACLPTCRRISPKWSACFWNAGASRKSRLPTPHSLRRKTPIWPSCRRRLASSCNRRKSLPSTPSSGSSLERRERAWTKSGSSPLIDKERSFCRNKWTGNNSAQGGGEKVDLMIASYRLVCRLQGPWGLADPNRKDAPEGKMARLWAEKSGLPPKSEQDAMQPRLNALKKTIKTSTVAVYPVRVSGKSDAPLAAWLAELLTKEGLGRAEASATDPKLQIQPSTNQTRIIWDLARAFQDFLRKNPPAADYALLADYGIGRTTDGKTVVGGVQFVLCDRKGDWVLVDLQNSHHADFQRINPQSPDDCNRLVVEALKKAVREPTADGLSERGVLPAKDEKLRQELLERMAEDQRARQEFIKSSRQHKGVVSETAKDALPPAVTRMLELDRRNTARMQEIVDRYGWPGIAMVGQDGEYAAWLLVQHADRDHAFQKRCLVLITEAVQRGQAPPRTWPI